MNANLVTLPLTDFYTMPTPLPFVIVYMLQS